MNVACAVSSMSGDYRRWFKNLSIIEHENNVTKGLDLLILTGGGSDISPERYRAGYNGACGVDLERDEREFNILKEVMDKNPGVNVLGVCRGMQLINVFFKGSLVQDLDSINSGHSRVHNLKHMDKSSPFTWLEKTNSLHHQAISYVGDFYPHIMAVEPMTSVIEMVSWGNSVLGVQFHPEMFASTPGDRFFSIIKDWVVGNICMPRDSIMLDKYPSISIGGIEDIQEEEPEEGDPEYDGNPEEEEDDPVVTPGRLSDLYARISTLSMDSIIDITRRRPNG